jgi:hypothetical protein
MINREMMIEGALADRAKKLVAGACPLGGVSGAVDVAKQRIRSHLDSIRAGTRPRARGWLDGGSSHAPGRRGSTRYSRSPGSLRSERPVRASPTSTTASCAAVSAAARPPSSPEYFRSRPARTASYSADPCGTWISRPSTRFASIRITTRSSR